MPMSASHLVALSLLLVFVSLIRSHTSTASLLSCNIPCMTEALLHPDDVASCSLCTIPSHSRDPHQTAAFSTPLSLLTEARASATRLYLGDPDPNGILLSLQRIHEELLPPPLLPATAEAESFIITATPLTIEQAEVQFILAAGWGESFCEIFYSCALFWGLWCKACHTLS